MKKIKRIFLLLLPCSFLFLGTWFLIDEFLIYNFFSKIKKDPTLLIPLFILLFSVFSFLFGIHKFQKNKENRSSIYKVLRVGDLIFSSSLSLLFLAGIYFLSTNSIERGTNFYLIRYVIFLVLLAFSILLFVDNLIYHKGLKKDSNKDDIDKIGI